jgi:hypothetical protein
MHLIAQQGAHHQQPEPQPELGGLLRQQAHALLGGAAAGGKIAEVPQQVAGAGQRAQHDHEAGCVSEGQQQGDGIGPSDEVLVDL